MLREDQAAELLKRCESINGVRLEQVRGNLRNAESRSAAIWELLVFEEVSRHGEVEYEPHEGGSPDILLTLPNGRKIWIEVAFLYPRFWKEERQSDAISIWLCEEAVRRNIEPSTIYCRFDGDSGKAAGPVLVLPRLHEKRQFLTAPEIKKFFDTIQRCPSTHITQRHSHYSIELKYLPGRHGPYRSYGGLLQETPRTLKEHAVYRTIRAKIRQHRVTGPRLVCLGSDQSPVLSTLARTRFPSVRDAVGAIFETSKSLSGVIIVEILCERDPLRGFMHRAEGEIFRNPRAAAPILDEDMQFLLRLEFNRWKYCSRLGKFEQDNNAYYRRAGGDLVVNAANERIVMELPAHVLIDALAGKTDLNKQYVSSTGDPMLKYINDGWIVVGCSFKGGDIEKGEDSRVILELAPPPEHVYWPEKISDN